VSALIEALKAIAAIPDRPCVAEYDLDDLEAVLCGLYGRVSLDKSKRERSIVEQIADAVAVTERKRRWSFDEDSVFTDVGSAWKRKAKRRADFDQLIRELEADTYRPHVLMIWEVSRSTRRVEEMKTVLALARWRGKYVYVIDDRRLCSPWSTNDWGYLMNAAVDAEKESMRTSSRGQRSSTADAKAGNFTGGRRPFGFDSNGVDHRRGQEPGTLDEVALIHEAVERILSGADSPRSIAKSWNERGIPTSCGNEWHPGPLSKMLKSPRLIGLRTHDDEVIGRGVWEPILEPKVQRRLIAALDARSPVGRTPGRKPWLLTKFLRCTECDGTLSSFQDNRGVKRYRCRKGPGYRGCGAVTIKAEPLEDVIGLATVRRLENVAARRRARLSENDDDEQRELDEIAADRLQLAADRKVIGRDQWLVEVGLLDRRQKALNARIAAKASDNAPLDYVLSEEAGFVGRSWLDISADVHEARRLLEVFVESVSIAPSTNVGSNRFDEDRIKDVVWRN